MSITITTSKRVRTSIAVSSLVLLASACGFMGPKVETETYTTPDGAIVVESVELTATVKAVDGRARTLTLDPKYGDEQTFEVGPEAKNFDQIRVGDELHVELVEELAVSLIPGGADESVGALDAVAYAPVGEKPAIAAVSTRSVTADIVAIDSHDHRVTLEFIDGSVASVKVGKHIDLSKVSLNDSVRIQIAEAVLIDFSKPE